MSVAILALGIAVSAALLAASLADYANLVAASDLAQRQAAGYAAELAENCPTTSRCDNPGGRAGIEVCLLGTHRVLQVTASRGFEPLLLENLTPATAVHLVSLNNSEIATSGGSGQTPQWASLDAIDLSDFPPCQ